MTVNKEINNLDLARDPQSYRYPPGQFTIICPENLTPQLKKYTQQKIIFHCKSSASLWGICKNLSIVMENEYPKKIKGFFDVV